MNIEQFVPEKTTRIDLDIEKLNVLTGRGFEYASRGRYSIGHILATYCSEGDAVLIPAYFCPTIKDAEKLIKVNYIYYDIDLEDLNPSANSINIQLSLHKEIKVVVVPSYYGNPANLTMIEKICQDYGVAMIDDAAQSFGAKLDGKYVGTFGNGGLLSFSPGKATPGHMGSLFWSQKSISYYPRKHPIYHMMCYANYRVNRVGAYKKKHLGMGKVIRLLFVLLDKHVNIENDRIEGFEVKLLGGYLWQNLERIEERKRILDAYVEQLKSNDYRIITGIRGESNPCKIVLLFQDKKICDCYKTYLNENNIAWFGGYKGLLEDLSSLRNTSLVVNHIIELPIELNESHMEYMLHCLKGMLA